MFVLLLFFSGCSALYAQQKVAVISRCGGIDSATIPTITDNDQDGMDDALEQKLIEHFTPVFIQFDNESCPGPSTAGTGDSNLVVCHVYPLPQQYTTSNNLDSVKNKPTAVVPSKGLTTGLVWYKPLIKVNAALLYGKDCGLLGHTSDVEGFNYSLRYTGPDSLAGWMYDTVMQNWAGGVIQTISHAGTPCQHIETEPYSVYGRDTVYASPDKHGNYLTTGGCGSSFICNPGCGGVQSVKTVKPVNIGEPGASLVNDLGAYYTGYTGEDPWSTSKFLETQGGDAGTIRDKMLLKLTSDFAQGQAITTQAQICGYYNQCYGPFGSSYVDYTCAGEPYFFNGKNLQNAGVYYDTLVSYTGCDSLITLNFSVHPKVVNPSSVSTCNTSYQFQGQTLTAGGIYTDTLSTAYGCDSVLLLNLTLLQASAYSYQVKVCEGGNYTFNGNIIDEPGIYTDTMPNAAGCDSAVTLQLIIDSLQQPVWNTATDTMLSTGNALLLLASPPGGSFSGNGVIGNVFFPATAGPGVHTITYTIHNSTGCTASVIHSLVVLVTGVEDLSADKFVLFPNPAESILSVKCNTTNGSLLGAAIFNAVGQEVTRTFSSSGNELSFDVSALVPGSYWVKLRFADKTVTKKFVK